MVTQKNNSLAQTACLLAAVLFYGSPISAAANELITMESKMLKASACDNRQKNDDQKTSENRAVDAACLTAVKKSGIIQKYDSELPEETLNIVAYQLIDEYLFNLTHKVTEENSQKVCVSINADIEVTSEKIKQLIALNKKSETTAEITEIAEEVNQEVSVKPQTLNEKKLLYIGGMSFWDGTISNHYRDLLRELFSHSDYFYVTEDADIADYIVTTNLKNAEVDKIDNKNHKMQMVLELAVTAPRQKEFKPMSETQNHFILFAADKNEQQIADTLIRKLLTRAAERTGDKINKFIQNQLENKKVRGK